MLYLDSVNQSKTPIHALSRFPPNDRSHFVHNNRCMDTTGAWSKASRKIKKPKKPNLPATMG